MGKRTQIEKNKGKNSNSMSQENIPHQDETMQQYHFFDGNLLTSF